MQTFTHPTSEVTALRARIEQEHQAACWALTGLASGMAQHHFINRRMQAIDRHHETLVTLIGEQASLAIVNEVFEQSPPQPPVFPAVQTVATEYTCTPADDRPCAGRTLPS